MKGYQRPSPHLVNWEDAVRREEALKQDHEATRTDLRAAHRETMIAYLKLYLDESSKG